tara:strand:- start:198 stop:458 length:261 start_codon:yes stop_codon:yes gene_type:complete
MGQYRDLVDRQRKLLAVEKWRKGVKLMSGEFEVEKKLWTTTYNDESQLFEKLQDNKWTSMKKPSVMTIQDCVDQMSREEQDVKYWK